MWQPQTNLSPNTFSWGLTRLYWSNIGFFLSDFLRNIKVENCFKAGASSGLWCVKTANCGYVYAPKYCCHLANLIMARVHGQKIQCLALNISHILIILVSNHISTYCFLMFLGNCWLMGPLMVPSHAVPIQSGPRWSNRHGPWSARGTRWLPTTNAWKFVVSGWNKRPGVTPKWRVGWWGMVTLW